MLSKERPVRVEIFLTEEESEKLIAKAKKDNRSRKNLIEAIVMEYLNKVSRKGIDTLKLVVFSLLFFSCDKNSEIIPKVEFLLDPNISKVKDFEIEMPYGNEFYADSSDSSPIYIHCFDSTGNVLPIPKTNPHNFKIFIDGFIVNSETFSNGIGSFKTKTANSYRLTVEVNGIKKEVFIKSIPITSQKLYVVPIIFNQVDEDFPDEIYLNTLSGLNSTYNKYINIKFTFKEFDSKGNKLTRKGISNFKKTNNSLDNIDDTNDLFRTEGCLNVFVENRNTTWSGGYNRRDIIVNTKYFRYEDLTNKDSGKIPAFTVMYHEMGHYFGLAHIYRNDNKCEVQPGVNDIEAYNISNLKNNNGKPSYVTNCGNLVQYQDNLMNGGKPLITKDQLKIILANLNKQT